MRSSGTPRLALLLALACSACGGSAPVTPVSTGPPIRPSVERCEDPRVVALRADLDMLRASGARAKFIGLEKELEELAGPESLLLRARLFGLLGDLNSAQPMIESARLKAPDDARVYATAAELHAAVGQYETASLEIKEGLQRCGQTPELVRAQGILHICTPKLGYAERGLVKLERARELDPALPFCDKPLGQAHMLVGRRELAEGEKEKALSHAKLSLEFDPSETDAWHFLAEVWSSLGEHEKAIEILDKLVDLGQELSSELAMTHKNAGMQSLVDRDHEGAKEHFMAARSLGLNDEELGFGTQFMLDQAEAQIALGVEAFTDSDLATAKTAFEKAIQYDPANLGAHNHLGIVLFKMSDYDGAIEAWRWVIDRAQADDIDLPDPVHINLAKALVRQDDLEGARLALEEYKLSEPFGDFIDETEKLLARLPEDG